ncbi:MAG: lysoplasmalogenase [Anaerolineaceae bacterium]
MYAYWLIPAVIAASLQWYARWRGQRVLHYVTKPAVMVLLLAWLWQATRFEGFAGWIGLALLLSRAGDIFLMLPPSFFMAGLAAFLLGHVCFMAGFLASQPADGPWVWAAGAALLAVALFTLQTYWKALGKKLYSRKVRGGVSAYILVANGMIFSALSTLWRPDWALVNALLAAGGAVLFGISDSMLAYNRFIRKIPHAHVWIMITYHLAQMLITSAAIRQALSL